MMVGAIYIIITISVIALYYLVLEPTLKEYVEYTTIRKMLCLELTNEIVNTSVLLDKIGSKNSHLNKHNIIRNSLLCRQVSDPEKDRGEDFILYIEQWLLFDAKERKSSYRFYPDQRIYNLSIDPQTQFHISLWVKEFLGLLPDHLDLALSIKDDMVQLRIHEVVQNDTKIRFDSYLTKGTWNHLPGQIQHRNDGVLIIDFSLR